MSEPATVASTAEPAWTNGLVGRALSPAANARAAWAAGVLSLFVLVPLLLAALWPSVPFAAVLLRNGEALAVTAFGLAGASVVFASTAWALGLPRWAQWPLLAVVVLVLAAVYAWPAAKAPGIEALDSDHYMLAPFMLAFALPFGAWLHPTLPFRAFLIAALVVFGLTLPDFLGLYTVDTGTRTVTMHGVHQDYDIRLSSHAAEYRASGIQLTWFLLCAGAAWAGLIAGWLIGLVVRWARPVR